MKLTILTLISTLTIAGAREPYYRQYEEQNILNAINRVERQIGWIEFNQEMERREESQREYWREIERLRYKPERENSEDNYSADEEDE